MATALDTLWKKIAEHGVLSVVEAIGDQEAIELAETFGTHNYHPLPINIVRARGAFAYDGSGKEYIDCIGAYSAVAHGHLSKVILKTIDQQLGKLALTSRAFYTSELALFLKCLAEYCELDMVCPMNTGVEAVETCLKLARKWAYTAKQVPMNEAEIIVCENNFHGRTTTVVGFSSEELYRHCFGPYGPGFKMVPFGDVEALERAITPNTAAFLAEPIQAEGGIIIPPEGYLREARRVCDQNKVLLIWDEVQTGFCRTGKRFAWMHEDARPDLLAVGKPLGGGVLPVSAAIGRREVMEMFVPGEHGSTFGGNPLAASVAVAAMAEMETQDYAGLSARFGALLKEGFEQMNSPLIKEVRGKGLLVGLEVHEWVDSEKLTKAFLDQGILTKETRSRTFRFAPPIVSGTEIIDAIIERTRRSLTLVNN